VHSVIGATVIRSMLSLKSSSSDSPHASAATIAALNNFIPIDLNQNDDTARAERSSRSGRFPWPSVQCSFSQ
jgi:hypothetical protein